MSWPDVEINKEVAAEALRGVAYHVVGEEWQDGARTLVHTFTGTGPYFGADHDLEDALRDVERATEIAWVTHPLHHDLAVRVGGRDCYYDVPRPERAAGQ